MYWISEISSRVLDNRLGQQICRECKMREFQQHHDLWAKKAHLILWDYVFKLWDSRNKLVYGDQPKLKNGEGKRLAEQN